MRYSDVAQKYYKDTKNRILENVLAAENGGERSDGRIIGEKESKEKNIMTNSTATVRNSKGIIAAACALVMLGSSTFVMHRLRTSDDREVSSRPDKVKSTVVTSSDEDTTSEVNEEDNETAPDADDSISEKSEEKKQEKKNDSGKTTSAAEKADNSTIITLTDNSAKKTDTSTKSDNSTPVSTVNDSTAAADSSVKADSNGSSADIRQADSTADIDYSLDEDNYINDDARREVDEAAFICEGTVTSKEIYGRTRTDEFKPLSEYTEDEMENVGRLYFRCTVRLDGRCFKGSELVPYLSQLREYDAASGDMVVTIPIGRRTSEYDDEFAGTYAETIDEADNTDLYNVGEKLLLAYYMELEDGALWKHAENVYRYDEYESMYHNVAYYVPTLKEEHEIEDYDGVMNYVLNTFKGGTPEAAEHWLSYLGKSYMIKYIPSKRFASGEVVSVNYSQPDGCYVIYVAE